MTPTFDAPALPALPQRDPSGHKGDFGRVCVIGGCAEARARMLGAPALAARAALRSGAGLCMLVAPDPILSACVALTPSATGRALPVDEEQRIIASDACEVIDEQLDSADVAVVGVGFGVGPGQRAATLRVVQRDDCFVVVDADGLNVLAQTPELSRDFHASAVLTPHPGEFGRLAESLRLGKYDTASPEGRAAGAEALAQRIGAVVILKGAPAAVSDGHRTWINDQVDSALATGGTGDVLAGLCAGLIGQFAAKPLPPGLPEAARAKWPRDPRRPLDLFDCARLAVRIHAFAAVGWRAEHHADSGLLASELADAIPPAMSRLREAPRS
ncbi:MAG: NAD(P)H-hydrate dehydratase [Phycisphaerales bacterium JB039]